MAVRREILRSGLGLVAAVGIGGVRDATAYEPLEWALWRGLHIGPQGQIVDDANNRITHSEGQGYGLLLAVAFDDPGTFARIWSWTRTHLLIRDDGLMAWRWEESPRPGVTDINNATDGDLLVAWALVLAAERWDAPAYGQAADDMAASILRHATIERGGRLLMLPGVEGFIDPETGTVVVNPSYWVFPALEDLYERSGDERWRRLYVDGLALMEDGRRPHRTIADWLAVDVQGAIGPARAFGFRTGYNAYRVPLYLLWAGETTRPVLDAFAGAWSGGALRTMPMEISAEDGLTVSVSDDPGYQDLPALLRCVRGEGSAYLPTRMDATRSYYAATLALLTRIVARERYPRCLQA